jgi:hypothetical protein
LYAQHLAAGTASFLYPARNWGRLRAPAGQVINASEEEVRDLLADFRLATYQAAIQLRLEAAQAASPPSAAPGHG